MCECVNVRVSECESKCVKACVCENVGLLCNFSLSSRLTRTDPCTPRFEGLWRFFFVVLLTLGYLNVLFYNWFNSILVAHAHVTS